MIYGIAENPRPRGQVCEICPRLLGVKLVYNFHPKKILSPKAFSSIIYAFICFYFLNSQKVARLCEIGNKTLDRGLQFDP